MTHSYVYVTWCADTGNEWLEARGSLDFPSPAPLCASYVEAQSVFMGDKAREGEKATEREREKEKDVEMKSVFLSYVEAQSVFMGDKARGRESDRERERKRNCRDKKCVFVLC